MRIGDIGGNFKNSVLDRISNNSELKPKWGYNSDKCCAIKCISNSIHSLIMRNMTNTNCYILFLPNKKSGIIGIAKIKHINKRELGPLVSISSTNEENGWNLPTITGLIDWDYEIEIEKYWDFSKIFSINGLDDFSYNKLFVEKSKRLSQSSIHILEKYPELYIHLLSLCSYIINYLKPTYDDI
jgi:hypothetical protein